MLIRTLVLLLLLGMGSAQAALVGLYNFNNGNANDNSGNGNHGVVGADVGFAAVGPMGDGAASFTASIDSFIDVPIDINFAAMPNLTMGAWINPNASTSSVAKVLSHDSGSFDRTLGFDTRGGAGISIFTGTGVFGAEPAPIDTWHFIAVRYDGTTAQLTVNTNQSSTIDQTDFDTGLLSLRIGGNPTFGERFAGLIDGVFVFDEVLSDAELENIRLNGISAVPLPAAVWLLLGTLPLFARKRSRA